MKETIYAHIMLQMFCKHFDDLSYITFTLNNVPEKHWYEVLHKRVGLDTDEQWCDEIGVVSISK
jgi:hypothetical protein